MTLDKSGTNEKIIPINHDAEKVFACNKKSQ